MKNCRKQWHSENAEISSLLNVLDSPFACVYFQKHFINFCYANIDYTYYIINLNIFLHVYYYYYLALNEKMSIIYKLLLAAT